MPQGRRRVPFSGKAKKERMQIKKIRKAMVFLNTNSSDDDTETQEAGRHVKKINAQPGDNKNRGRYALQFFQETKEELQKRKKEAQMEIQPRPLIEQECSDNYFPSELDMPKRPPWDFSMSKTELDMREQKYFTEYLKQIQSIANISYFELNLETWRQLWRVTEMSDILLIIVDIRYPVMMFPPYLYKHITEDLGKEMILVLNKIDLAPAALVVAWQDYFTINYPKLHILVFTSFPAYNLRDNAIKDKGLKSKRRKGKLKMAAEGAQKIMETCKEIVKEEVDLTSWHQKIQEEIHMEHDSNDTERTDNIVIEKKDTSYFEHEKYKNGVLTIGCVGLPNVGKSSLINALMGKKVVSVSKTPGHTKHFQTIFLTKNVRLCDCPGLVFPSVVPKQFQILMGSFPIAQVREPYTPVKYLAECVDLPKLLKLQHQSNDDTWSAMDICDSWAAKRNFYNAKSGRLDTYRAANNLLRMTLEGKICVYVYPPKWSIEEEQWKKHPNVETIKWIQARNNTDDEKLSESNDSLSETEEDEECENDEEYEGTNKDSNEEDSDDSSSEEEVQYRNKFELLDQ